MLWKCFFTIVSHRCPPCRNEPDDILCLRTNLDSEMSQTAALFVYFAAVKLEVTPTLTRLFFLGRLPCRRDTGLSNDSIDRRFKSHSIPVCHCVLWHDSEPTVPCTIVIECRVVVGGAVVKHFDCFIKCCINPIHYFD